MTEGDANMNEITKKFDHLEFPDTPTLLFQDITRMTPDELEKMTRAQKLFIKSRPGVFSHQILFYACDDDDFIDDDDAARQ